MEKLKAIWTKIVEAFDWAAGWVSAYPKTALALLIVFAIHTLLKTAF